MASFELALPLAAFVGNQTWFTLLIVIHVVGAIVGLGPSFAFGFIANNAGKEPSAAVPLLSTMMDIERKMVTPVAIFTQPLTGVLLIFVTRRNEGFFENEWLIISLVAYFALMFLAYAKQNPATDRLIHAMKEGSVGTPAFERDLKTTKGVGPMLGILGLIIIVMMVWKPGDF